MTTVNDLFEQYALAALERQLQLHEIIGDHDWQVDLDTGFISFGSDRQFPVQILGTWSSQSWLWAWANTASNIPEPLLQCANQLKAFGVQHGIAEFTQPELRTEQLTGYKFAMIAVGICQKSAFYRGPFPGGESFMVLDVLSISSTLPSTAPQLINAVTMLISTFPCNHRNCLTAYLRGKKFKFADTNRTIEFKLPNGDVIRAVYDQTDRIIETKQLS